MILNVLFYFIDCNYCKSNSSELLINLFYSYSYSHMCLVGELYRKTYSQFIVAYNNSYRIIYWLPMRRSASGMFATDNVNSCTCVIRKSMYSLTTRIFIVRRLSVTHGSSYCILCSVDFARQHLAFAFLLFNSISTGKLGFDPDI